MSVRCQTGSGFGASPRSAASSGNSDNSIELRNADVSSGPHGGELTGDIPLGGPFADRSGGLITFEGASVEEAERLVSDDPFVREDLLETHWVKEWTID
jgi:hypothetical protein